jgi:hypothetical protein
MHVYESVLTPVNGDKYTFAGGGCKVVKYTLKGILVVVVKGT